MSPRWLNPRWLAAYVRIVTRVWIKGLPTSPARAYTDCGGGTCTNVGGRCDACDDFAGDGA